MRPGAGYRSAGHGENRPGQTRYEESIVLLRAISTKKAEEKARAIFLKQQSGERRFLNQIEICPIFEEPSAGAEVHWFRRLSPLSAERYVLKHWDDGLPRSCRLRRSGVFALGLACGLAEHGLAVTFFSEADQSRSKWEKLILKRAVKFRTPDPWPKLMQHS
ncbi:MAG: hypothetical protein HKL90_07475 [Elusimicrobia bacterium]|nr:hypothetical protein [Elusimicrobiota bacterium]